MAMTNIKSTTWLDRFPTEIIFHIFDYLSSNDIITTFIFFSRRFNHLLLKNQRYLIHLELSTTNLNLWQIIISDIGSQIESLNISTIDLPFPLSLFPNLKSLIISSPYGLSNEQLESILESNQFNNLHTLKIKQNKICSTSLHIKYLTNQDNLFKKVFNNRNSLRTFQCSSVIEPFRGMSIDSLKTNFNLHSLTLILQHFRDIYSLIEYTPNLNYLNITTEPFDSRHAEIMKTRNMKLKRFHLKIVKQTSKIYGGYSRQINFNVILNGIKQLPLSSLICLSLNFVDVKTERENSVQINGIQLKQFLESMSELKQFHLYAKLGRHELNSESILRTFKDQFWFDHNWSFGTDGRFFYTLPFHFDNLDLDFLFQCFDDIESNNPEILKTNSRLWYHVKSIDVHLKWNSGLNFVKELKMKMPNLTTIQFHDRPGRPPGRIIDLNERPKYQFDNVTTVHFAYQSIEWIRDWLIYALPNVKHLILYDAKFPSIESDLAPILNRQIQQLFLNINDEQFEKLAKTNYVYFSNVEHIYLDFSTYHTRTSEQYAILMMKILKNFENLKILVIYMSKFRFDDAANMGTELHEVIKYLYMNEILKNYQVKHNQEYSIFSKKTLIFM